ncbi:hypothetical protein [Neorhizobium galegae]|uniref:hypothetical protein n=1 Tax=Neorhizobium galegae TaxID=399 RepID=UPI003D7C2876
MLDRISRNCEHELDWWTCWTEDNVFRGAGGPFNFGRFLRRFETGQRASARMPAGILTPPQILTRMPNEPIGSGRLRVVRDRPLQPKQA